nr:MAG TPA: hypothetical protein [Caudoviricetes sp.]
MNSEESFVIIISLPSNIPSAIAASTSSALPYPSLEYLACAIFASL